MKEKTIQFHVIKRIGLEKFLGMQDNKIIDELRFISKSHFSPKLLKAGFRFEPVLQDKNLIISLVKRKYGGGD